MRRSLRWCALLTLFLAARLGALPAPSVDAGRDGLALTRLPPILGEEEVRKQLGTGLTTSFLFEAEARRPGGAKAKGGARVDVRYELWDEVYIVTRIDSLGRALRVKLPSFARLAEWWRDERLLVLRPAAASGADRLKIRLRVIPFSQAEQLDAQRWFSQALSAEKSGSAGALAEAAEDQPESFSQVINLLMATSIGRPALLEFDWSLTLPAGKKR